ncbi:hypothetical protein D1007_57828 [Hordeum vulgare]|nr:hypothetical protein D1007_57828 [Hordeum vulgare]
MPPPVRLAVADPHPSSTACPRRLAVAPRAHPRPLSTRRPSLPSIRLSPTPPTDRAILTTPNHAAPQLRRVQIKSIAGSPLPPHHHGAGDARSRGAGRGGPGAGLRRDPARRAAHLRAAHGLPRLPALLRRARALPLHPPHPPPHPDLRLHRHLRPVGRPLRLPVPLPHLPLHLLAPLHRRRRLHRRLPLRRQAGLHLLIPLRAAAHPAPPPPHLPLGLAPHARLPRRLRPHRRPPHRPLRPARHRLHPASALLAPRPPRRRIPLPRHPRLHLRALAPRQRHLRARAGMRPRRHVQEQAAPSGPHPHGLRPRFLLLRRLRPHHGALPFSCRQGARRGGEPRHELGRENTYRRSAGLCPRLRQSAGTARPERLLLRLQGLPQPADRQDRALRAPRGLPWRVRAAQEQYPDGEPVRLVTELADRTSKSFLSIKLC